MALPQFPGPWKVVQIHGGFVVEASNGLTLAWVYCMWADQFRVAWGALSPDEAREIAEGIASLPELSKHAEPALCPTAAKTI